MIRSMIAVSLVLSVPAIAAPKVGDRAEYAATVKDGANTADVGLVLELVQQDGAKFLQRTTVSYPSQQPKVTDEWKEGEQLLSDARLDSILADCVKEGGRLEQVTVPAGSFPSCAVDFDDAEAKGTEWVAKVPFGTARAVYLLKASNKNVDMQLKAFR